MINDTNPKMTIRLPHWFEYKAVHFCANSGRQPDTVTEWLRMVWNADIFFGPIPALKLTIVVSVALSLVL